MEEESKMSKNDKYAGLVMLVLTAYLGHLVISVFIPWHSVALRHLLRTYAAPVAPGMTSATS